MSLKLLKSTSAATLTEYALLLSGLIIVCISGVIYLGSEVDASLHRSSVIVSDDPLCTSTSPPGQRCSDGTIFVGIDTTTTYQIYTTRVDNDILSWTEATNKCNFLEESGHTDWRLPIESELQLIYHSRDVIGSFSYVPYWTGTELSATTATAIDFLDGLVGQVAKTNGFRSRCVRVVSQ